MRSRNLRWVHIVPLVHLGICVAAFSGYLIPALQPLGILVSLLMLADLPISLLYGLLAFGGQHDVLAGFTLFAGGTI
jgi:hypothetical protein